MLFPFITSHHSHKIEEEMRVDIERLWLCGGFNDDFNDDFNGVQLSQMHSKWNNRAVKVLLCAQIVVSVK